MTDQNQPTAASGPLIDYLNHEAERVGRTVVELRLRSDGLSHRAADEIERLRAALTRLRDCDWTITPLDRMDAVRDIARAALEGSNERPHC